MMKRPRSNRLTAIWATALILLASAPVAFSQSAGQKPLPETASQSWRQLLAASQAYRQSLARIVELQEQEEARAAELVAKQKMLLALGAISKRELEAGEQALSLAQAKLSGTRQQLEEVDQLMTEASAAEAISKLPSEAPRSLRAPRQLLFRERERTSASNARSVLLRYAGTSPWALRDFSKVEAFFRLQFGKPLAVSAYGQSATHNRLGFDHRAAIDVAIHPDSNEGQALTHYLREQGISFIAIRGAIPGSATGAHIHIGPPSKRTVTH
jgi:hypothetical protein